MSLIDLTDQRFGKLIVIERAFSKKGSNIKWLVHCDCGREKIVEGGSLKKGYTKSCGCLCGQHLVKDLTDKRFGKLLVVSRDISKNGCSQWKCICDCGNIKIVRASDLSSNSVRSCGCLKLSILESDLVGEKFGLVTVMKYSHSKNESRYWECLCKCGNLCYKTTHSLHSKSSNSCGCLHKEWLKNQFGENHWNWNPNRDEVEFYKKIRSRCCTLIKNCLLRLGKNKEDKTFDLLGYSALELAEYLKIKSKEDLDGYEIDHIFPVKAFTDYGIDDLKLINCFENLQLLTREENGPKGKWDKYDKEEFIVFLMSKNVR